MKKSFNEILNDLEPAELEKLTDGIDDRLDEVTSRRIAETALAKTGTEKQRTVRNPRKMKRAAIAIAACAALLASIAIGSFAVAEDAKEYREAITFFETNDLSTEGLTRSEIKKVYRDITTESFKYSKTAEVIAHNSEINSIPGWEMVSDGEILDSAAVKELWQAFINSRNSTGVRYRHDLILVHHDEGDGWNEEVGSYVEKYDGTELVWRTEFNGIYVDDVVGCGDGVFAYGASYNESDNYDSKYWLIRIDENGSILWRNRYGEKGEHMTSALAEEDGSFTLFSHPAKGAGYCFGRVDANGNIITRSSTALDGQYVDEAVHYRGGYLVRLFDFNEQGSAGFITVDREGNITDRFGYSSDTEYYFTKSLIEYGGRIYLSADAMPKEGTYISPDDPTFVTERSCLQPALDYAFGHFGSESGDLGRREIPGLTEKIKERFTAVLLVLDPEGGEPTEFYAVKGAAAGKLAVGEDGELVWECGDICSSEFSIATSAYTFICTTRIMKYTFSQDGKLTDSCETDEMERLLL